MIDIDVLFPLRSPAMSAALDAAPRHLLAANAQLNYRYPLAVEDRRYVQTSHARGEGFARRFHSKLGLDTLTGQMQALSPHGVHMLLFGHVGCGKSTELSHLAAMLHHPERYWVVHVDLLALIDPNDARYSDVWLAVAAELLRRLAEDGLALPDPLVRRFHGWFAEHVLTHERIRAQSGDLALESQVGGGVPLLGKLLGRFTAMIRAGSSCRDSLREVVRNTYAEFSGSLNDLIAAAADALRAQGHARQVLFVIDGPDRFRPEDWRRFFVDDVNQLTQLAAVVVYAAPLALKVSGHRLDLFEHVTLPMVKLLESDGTTRRIEAFDALRELILKRCHHSLFAELSDLDRLIEHSGGHLRDLLRLLSYACVDAEHGIIDCRAVDSAIALLGADYRYCLSKAHYLALVSIDQGRTNDGTTPLLTELVGLGALLEYNAGSWRQTHPVVRTLAGYEAATRASRINPLVAEAL